MSESTEGYLSKEITGKDVFYIITQKFDKDAKYDISIDPHDNTEMGNIYFKDGNDNRKIFYCIGEGTEGIGYKEGEKYSCLILGNWGNSVKIMTEIIKCFGGYIKENDCDDDAIPYYIPKDKDFKYDRYIEERNRVINILSPELNDGDKILITQEILKHKKEIKEIL